jgi:hypothetical protein
VTLYDNWKVNSRGGESTWQLGGDTLSIKLVTGDTVSRCECQLSEDGKTYTGKDQDGNEVRGRKIVN